MEERQWLEGARSAKKRLRHDPAQPRPTATVGAAGPKDPRVVECIYMNARSIKCVTRSQNKLALLHDLLSTFATQIIMITETWLTSNVMDSEVLPPHFQIHRKDRSETCASTRGGGLLVGVDHRLPSKRRSDLEGDCEILVCELICKSRSKVALVLCYRPPSSDRAAFNASLELTLDRVCSLYRHVCLIGDFNIPEIDWRRPAAEISNIDSDFLRIIQSNSLIQINTFPSNVHSNFLDLIFTTDCDLLSNISLLDCEYPTDHNVLSFELHLHHNACEPIPRTVFNYKRADIDQLNVLLSQVSLDVDNCDEIDNLWSECNEQVMSAIEQCVPKFTVKSSRDPPWFDAECRKLTKQKRILWKKAKKRNTEHLWQRYRVLRNHVKAVLKLKYDSYITSLGDLCIENPKRFWSFFRSKTRSHSIPVEITDGNSKCSNAKEKATLFNNYFSSLFTHSDNLTPNFVTPTTPAPIPLPSVTPDEISTILKSLSVNKACPPNDISPFILKTCHLLLSPLLCVLFNLILATGKIPSNWKRAHVVPIFKKGAKSHVGNYRPVSLLPVVSKVFERCIVNHVYPYLTPVLHKLQHGFLKKRSCTTQLLKVYHSIGAVLDRGGQVDIIYLDFSKAFDSVSHSLLLYKLENFYGFTDVFIKLFESYLRQRMQCVLIDGENSSWNDVTSGVPQGSILGPLLFLLFINDMPDVVTSSTTALFADDCKVFKEIKSRDDCSNLQNDLNALHQWSNKWEMSFNASKCKVLTITRSRNPISFDYHLDGKVLEHVGEFRDLGVIFNESLSFKSHISSLVSRCNKMSGIVKRSVGFNAPQRVKLTLFKALVRPHAEYSSQIWSPHSKTEIALLESIQRSMTRFICSYDMSYPERCMSLNVLPLSYRREVADLIFCFKCLNGYFDVDFTEEMCIFNSSNSLRSSHNGLLLQERRTRTEHFKAMYFNRVAHLWNILPLEIRECTCLSSFKSKLFVHYFTLLGLSYDSSNSCSWTLVCRCNGFYHSAWFFYFDCFPLLSDVIKIGFNLFHVPLYFTWILIKKKKKSWIFGTLLSLAACHSCSHPSFCPGLDVVWPFVASWPSPQFSLCFSFYSCQDHTVSPPLPVGVLRCFLCFLEILITHVNWKPAIALKSKLTEMQLSINANNAHCIKTTKRESKYGTIL